MARRLRFVPAARLLVVGAAALLLAACSGAAVATPTPQAADPSTDKLAQILARGTLVAYGTTDYAPQSFVVDGAVRPAGTKCLPNQRTGPELSGFDAETSKVLAKGLGVEVCFVDMHWTQLTSGHWGDNIDIAYGSGAINAERMPDLWMTQPYAYSPQRFVVRSDSSYQKPSDLDGKRIGICTGCTVESYLKGTLQIPGVDLVQKVTDPVLVGYEFEAPGLDALAAGETDAYLSAEQVAVDAIKRGMPLRMLDEPAFGMYLTGFVDKASGLDEAAFVARVNDIIDAAHADGTLKALSMQWFGADYTTPAAAFDISKLGQQIQ